MVRLRTASVVIGSTAVAMWGIAIAGIWGFASGRAAAVDLAGAGTSTVVSVLLAIAYRVRDRDKDALVRAMADYAVKRSTAATAPQERVA